MSSRRRPSPSSSRFKGSGVSICFRSVSVTRTTWYLCMYDPCWSPGVGYRPQSPTSRHRSYRDLGPRVTKMGVLRSVFIFRDEVWVSSVSGHGRTVPGLEGRGTCHVRDGLPVCGKVGLPRHRPRYSPRPGDWSSSDRTCRVGSGGLAQWVDNRYRLLRTREVGSHRTPRNRGGRRPGPTGVRDPDVETEGGRDLVCV